jgi:hypothetical protein
MPFLIKPSLGREEKISTYYVTNFDEIKRFLLKDSFEKIKKKY